MYYTFIMLKPDAIEKGLTEQIVTRLKNAGLTIAHVANCVATPEIIRRHYAEPIAKYGEAFRQNAERYFDGKMVIPMLLAHERADIIPFVRSVVGATDPASALPGTIRGDLGTDSLARSKEENRMCENLIHASDSPTAVREEAAIWFTPETCNIYFPED